MKKADVVSILEEQLRLANLTIESLRIQISTLQDTISGLNATIREKDRKLDEVHASIQSLEAALCLGKEDLEKQKRINRGLAKITENKSEKQPAAPPSPINLKERGNNKAKRNMHAGMEVQEHDLYPTESELNAAGAKEMAVRDSIRYEFIPSKFIKHIYHQHIFISGDSIVRAKLPMAPLQNSSFDGSFIAGIMELRYMYSMSVERITAYFNDHGFDITKATMNGLLTKTATLLENLYKCMRQEVLGDSYLGCDETYMKVKIPEATDSGKKIKKGYIWVVIARNSNLVYYFYEDGSRSKKVILNLLEEYEGNIQSDGFAPYRKLGGESYPKITRFPCLQHIKRKFMDIEGETDADLIISLINDLYHNDHLHKVGEDGWTEAKNEKWRKKYAPPILKQLSREVKRILGREDLDPQGTLYKAAVYLNNELPDVKNIFKNGFADLDNNLVERYNRYISLSRRNSLFYGSHEGAAKGALLYSLACSCRMNGINFFEYITDVLNQRLSIPDGSTPDAYKHLLPNQWKKGKVS